MNRRMITLWRIMQAGTRNFFRNAWLSTAATAMMVVTLSVILGAVIANYALNQSLQEVTKKIDISIFLKDNATGEQIEAMTADLQQLENVKAVRFLSKDIALANYREQFKDRPEVQEGVNEQENPLPASLAVEVKNLNQINPIIQVTKKAEYAGIVDDTSYEQRKRTIQTIANINNFLITGGTLLSIIFTSISILIIFNTIRMAIFSRSDEIQIMRLVGATNGYIRGPFLFEAMLDGIVAAVVSLGFAFTVLFVGGPKLVSFGQAPVSNTLLFFSTHWTVLALATIVVGILIGVISSVLAMVRYLKL